MTRRRQGSRRCRWREGLKPPAGTLLNEQGRARSVISSILTELRCLRRARLLGGSGASSATSSRPPCWKSFPTARRTRASPKIWRRGAVSWKRPRPPPGGEKGGQIIAYLFGSDSPRARQGLPAENSLPNLGRPGTARRDGRGGGGGRFLGVPCGGKGIPSHLLAASHHAERYGKCL